jgi:prevent-host-death family protein
MDQTLGIKEAGRQFDRLVEQVRNQGDTVVLIDDGEPAAALVPYALLEKWRKGRNEAFAVIDRIREKNRDLDMNEDELLAFIDESVQEVRRQAPI